MTTGRTLTPHARGDGPASTNESTLERLFGKVESLESMLTELSSRRFPTIERQLEDLRDLMTAHRKDHYLVGEVAAMAGRSEYTIRRWVAEGKLKAIRIAEGGPRGRLLVPRTELERLVSAGKGEEIPRTALA